MRISFLTLRLRVSAFRQNISFQVCQHNMALQFISDSPQAEAIAMIEDFHTRFGDAHYAFACHAAFPVSLTPPLLYKLRDYYPFRPDANTNLPFPWETVSDLLLSPLCKHVRRDRYEMLPEVRKVLLHELQEDALMGKTLIQQLSDFMGDEISQLQSSTNPNDKVWAQNQSWSIRVYQEPEKVIKEMADRLPDSEEKLQKDRSYLQIRQMADVMKVQAGNAVGKFEKLHLLTDRMAGYVSGQTQKLGREALQQLLDEEGRLVLGGKELFVPAKDIPPVEDPQHLEAEMGFEIARERIIQAIEKGQKELHLDRLNLKRIPEEIVKLDQLEVLDLSRNQLDHFPEQLMGLHNLQSLSLASNQLMDLEDKQMDYEFLQNLQSLDLSENQLHHSLIERLLHSLRQLKILNLNGNQLKDLPRETNMLQELRQLHIERNHFEEIPTIISRLEKLELLDISHNQIQGISSVVTNLEKLQTLDMGYNRVQHLPEDLLAMPQLIHVELTGNPIQDPPKSIWSQGLGPIRKYFHTGGRPTAPPVIFLAFAQVEESHLRLPQLDEEKKRIIQALQMASSYGLCEVVSRDVASFEDFEAVFTDPNYANRIAIFHYAGHINDSSLLLDEDRVVDKEKIISLLRTHRHLQLVFLNGASTNTWVEDLFEAGIPYVIATQNNISDKMASDFAMYFYQYLGYDISIRQALEKANAAIEEDFRKLYQNTR